jgi:hypothetical protein
VSLAAARDLSLHSNCGTVGGAGGVLEVQGRPVAEAERVHSVDGVVVVAADRVGPRSSTALAALTVGGGRTLRAHHVGGRGGAEAHHADAAIA